MKDSAKSLRIQETLDAEKAGVSTLSETIQTEDFLSAIDTIEERRGKIITLGIGKSGFIAMKTAATLTSLGHEAVFLNPLDALHGDSGIIKSGDVLLIFSFSGTSPEITKLIRHVRSHTPIHTILITGDPSSTLTKFSDHVISYRIDREGCPLGLAPMASTTAALVIADCIASALTSPEEFSHGHFARFHPAGSLGLSLKKVSEVMVTGEDLPVVLETSILNEALVEINLKKRGVVAVVDHTQRLVGVITDGDLRRIILNYDNPKVEIVGSIMTKEPKVITEDHSVKDALKVMEAHKIMNVFVVNESQIPVGLIHLHDIIENTNTH